jgi:uncharacterized ferredoxin-like protein
MIMKNPEKKEDVLLKMAEEICVAIRTAPKAKGLDNLTTMIVTGNDKDKIADKMEDIAKQYDHQGQFRDSKNVRQAQVLILLGTKIDPVDLKLCGLCGNKNCAESRTKKTVCIFNAHDLGIAVGAAVSKAADMRIDNRIMYSVGWAVREMNLLGEENKIIMGIPLSVSGKNPFFDRK